MNRFRLMHIVFVIIAFATSVFGQKLKAEDVLAKHLDSLGTAENRASVKSIFVVGTVSINFITRRQVPIEGRIVLASAGGKVFVGMNLNNIDYPSERFVSNGDTAFAAFIRNGARSVLGNFIQSNDDIIKDGIFGGTFTTAWVLSDTTSKKPKISLEGTKKIDGKEVYVLSYSPKGGSDVNVDLFFDKDTFRHVRTEYKRIISSGIGTRPDQSSGLGETRLKVIEEFSDFKQEKNLLTLPHKYRIYYSLLGQSGTSETEWISTLTDFAFNQTLDPKTFDIGSN